MASAGLSRHQIVSRRVLGARMCARAAIPRASGAKVRAESGRLGRKRARERDRAAPEKAR